MNTIISKNSKKLVGLILILSFINHNLQSQGFLTTPTNWSLPAGGHNVGGHNFGFYAIADGGTPDPGNQGWSLIDINGDGKTDLVITCQGDGTYRDCFSPGANPYWKVYLNNGVGFSSSATNWPLPPNSGKFLSAHDYGFNEISYAGSTSQWDQGWSTMDINGDNKPDLVIVCEGTGTYRECYSPGANPYWKVYLNTGTGFSSSATNWTLPPYTGTFLSGHEYGVNAIASAGTPAQFNQGWSTMDINGDNKPDLVVVCEGTGTYKECFSPGANPYWKVFLNNGSGFSTTATNWATPPNAGKWLSGHDYGFNGIADAGSANISDQGWSLIDMDGDKKPEMVILCEGTGTYKDCFSPTSNSYWKVHQNTGTGFSSSATNWNLPNGGKILSGHTYGFNEIGYNGTYDPNNQGWTVSDIDGDGKTDLIITSQGNGTYKDCFSPGSNPYWKVFLNAGTGFAASSVNWTLPAGGMNIVSHNFGFNGYSETGTYDLGNQGWSTLDINGDGKSDLVVVCEGTGSFRDSFTPSSSPHWKVFISGSTVGLNSITKSDFRITVYPNPTKDKIIIETENNDIIKLIDMFGKLLQEKECEKGKTELNLSEYSNGIYFVVNKNGNTVKVIKN
ncbi:MAG: T9SS type A sorting domain-containing protein [Bacteroidia bacterium]